MFVEAEAYQSPLLPEHIREGLADYIERRRLPGHFLTAVLENDLAEAVARADATNLPKIPDIVSWLFNEAPMASWGSRDKVEKWSAARRA